MRRFQNHPYDQPFHQPRRFRIFHGIQQGIVIGIAFGLIVNVMSKKNETNPAKTGSDQALLSRSEITLNSISPLDKINQKISNAMAKSRIRSSMTAEKPGIEPTVPETLSLKSVVCSTAQAARADVLEKVRVAVTE